MKKKVAFALCTALMLCSVSVAALAAEPMTDADTVSTMISAADTLPGISAYPPRSEPARKTVCTD